MEIGSGRNIFRLLWLDGVVLHLMCFVYPASYPRGGPCPFLCHASHSIHSMHRRVLHYELFCRIIQCKDLRKAVILIGTTRGNSFFRCENNFF